MCQEPYSNRMHSVKTEWGFGVSTIIYCSLVISYTSVILPAMESNAQKAAGSSMLDGIMDKMKRQESIDKTQKNRKKSKNGTTNISSS